MKLSIVFPGRKIDQLSNWSQSIELMSANRAGRSLKPLTPNLKGGFCENPILQEDSTLHRSGACDGRLRNSTGRSQGSRGRGRGVLHLRSGLQAFYHLLHSWGVGSELLT